MSWHSCIWADQRNVARRAHPMSNPGASMLYCLLWGSATNSPAVITELRKCLLFRRLKVLFTGEPKSWVFGIICSLVCYLWLAFQRKHRIRELLQKLFKYKWEFTTHIVPRISSRGLYVSCGWTFKYLQLNAIIIYFNVLYNRRQIEQ